MHSTARRGRMGGPRMHSAGGGGYSDIRIYLYCMCVCVCVCVYVCVSVCIYKYSTARRGRVGGPRMHSTGGGGCSYIPYIYIYLYICVCVCMYINTYIYMCVCAPLYVCIYIAPPDAGAWADLACTALVEVSVLISVYLSVSYPPSPRKLQFACAAIFFCVKFFIHTTHTTKAERMAE